MGVCRACRRADEIELAIRVLMGCVRLVVCIDLFLDGDFTNRSRLHSAISAQYVLTRTQSAPFGHACRAGGVLTRHQHVTVRVHRYFPVGFGVFDQMPPQQQASHALEWHCTSGAS